MLRKFGNTLVFVMVLAAIGVLVWIFIEGSKCAFKKANEFCTEKRNEWREEQERRNMTETSLKRIYEDTLGLNVAYKEWEEAVNRGKSEDIVKNHMRFMAVVENSKYFSNDGQFMVKALKQNIERKEAYVKHGMSSFENELERVYIAYREWLTTAMLMKGGNIPKDEKVLSSKRSDFIRLAKDTMMIHEKDGLRIVCLLDLMARQVTDTPLSDEEKKKELMLQ